jgi:hypothetical protein
MDNDDDWKAAEAALEKARSLPGGPERIEALKEAGKLRFAADQKRLRKEPPLPGRLAALTKRSIPIQ